MRSLRTRLAALFFLIALGVLATVYLTVVPGLEQRLVAQKLEDLARDARQSSEPVRRAVGTNVSRQRLDALVRQAADVTNTRVTLLGVSGGTELQTYVTSDSFQRDDLLDLAFPAPPRAPRGTPGPAGRRAGRSPR